ncbi:MAG: ISKra4 family transposase, partial [Cytophagales bacterium]|nr:ISKra4 family transposase [Cytophagales bacterium]
AKSIIASKFENQLNQEYYHCPCCGKRLKARSEKVRREILTMIGPIELFRPYFYCEKCKSGYYPFDEALGLADGKIQPDVKELEAWLVSEEPFDRASETFLRSTGIDISAHHMHTSANGIAEDLQICDICPARDEVESHVINLSQGQFRRPIMMLGIDGAHTPTRPEPSKRNEK